MADKKKVYDDLMIINLYLTQNTMYDKTFEGD